MNNAADDVNLELHSVQKGDRCVRIGFEDNAGSHDFRFFNWNLLRCWYLLINLVHRFLPYRTIHWLRRIVLFIFLSMRSLRRTKVIYEHA